MFLEDPSMLVMRKSKAFQEHTLCFLAYTIQVTILEIA